MADQLIRSAFVLATADIQAAEKLLPKTKAPFAPPKLVRSAHSRRGGLAATFTVAARSSAVLSTSVEHVGVRTPTVDLSEVPLSGPSSLEMHDSGRADSVTSAQCTARGVIPGRVQPYPQFEQPADPRVSVAGVAVLRAPL